MKSKDTIKSLVDDTKWRGGWYQDITFPDGSRTVSTTVDFEKHPSRSLKKWEIIEPYLSGGRFLDIGCNAGGYLVKASKYYGKLYGIESSEHFLKQCRYVLECFGVNAKLFCSPALDFDFSQLPIMDTTIMVNALYWLAYSDERGYVQNAESRLHKFMDTLKTKTKELILIGGEAVPRIGGELGRTVNFVGQHFDIVESRMVPFPDRMLNFIHARS